MSYKILFYKGRNEEEASLVGSITTEYEETNNYFKDLLSGSKCNHILSFISCIENHPHGFLDLNFPYKSHTAESDTYVLSNSYSFLTEEQFKNQEAINALIEKLPVEKIKKLFKDNVD